MTWHQLFYLMQFKSMMFQEYDDFFYLFSTITALGVIVNLNVWNVLSWCEIWLMSSLQKKTSYCGGFFAEDTKTAAICHILQHFFEPPMYMRYIAAFHWTPAINIAFCRILQRLHIKPPQYMCFSSVWLSFSGIPLNRHNKYSLLLCTIAGVYKTNTIYVFKQCLN